MLSRDQADPQKRRLGLWALRAIYKMGEVGLINRMWKACKSSFDIQPYNTIDIASLSLTAELGSGTFGTVREGTWQQPDGTSRKVAVKFIQENTQMFDLSDLRGEFVALSLIDHPNVISMHGGGFIEQDLGFQRSIHWYIVMDLMEGNLAQLIETPFFKNVSQEMKYNLCHQICNGLAHLHLYQIIHRDIKPANILV